ncbi:hypothetical protein CPB85DRAFT_179349 [Mucidula mucida]|nr:hypothetical protein CPB85DRAFT_179349 [Mucidula mucida]
MSVPEGFSILDITGTFTMNKTLSDDTDEVLRLQGVGWAKRRVISYATITLYIKHYKDDEGIEHVDIDQKLTGGIPGTTENRTLIWKERHNEDHLFGPVIGKSRRVKVEELGEEEWLKTGWSEDTIEHGVIQAYAESDTAKSGTTWIANQTWGVEVLNGERRYIRHLHFTGPGGEDIRAKLVYDYYGPN